MTPSIAIAQLRHLYAQMIENPSLYTAEAARGLLGPAIAALEAAHTPSIAPIKWNPLAGPPKVTRPLLSVYTEDRYLRELRAIKGLTEGEIQGALRRSRESGEIVTPGGNSSFIGGLVAWCPQCDCMRVNDGPDSHAYRCRTCGTHTGGGNMVGLNMLAIPNADLETARLHTAVQEAGVDGGLATSEAIEALERHETALARASTAANAIIAQQADEMKALQDEIDHLKTGIKTAELTMVVDGGDMADWGWVTQLAANRRAAVVVKPLVWTTDSAIDSWVTHRATHDGFPIATIRQTASAFVLYTLWNRDEGDRFLTLEAAQAAAQREWGSFIRGALQPC